jgi:hypothetical protein
MLAVLSDVLRVWVFGFGQIGVQLAGEQIAGVQLAGEQIAGGQIVGEQIVGAPGKRSAQTCWLGC